MRKRQFKAVMLASSLLTGVVAAAPGWAQEAEDEEDTVRDVIQITGTRITAPNVVSASPINTIGQAEIAFQQTPEIERVFRDLPITIPGDGQNVNNGTAGAATVDLRGLGTQRSLILIDGKRMVPYNFNGIVDVGTIPTSMLERVDIITGGASAVYGSDAMAGAVNFILRDDFEGVEFSGNYTISGEGDGDIYSLDTLLGAGTADGRGHVVLGMNYTKREPVLLNDRPFGIVGVDSETGSGLDGNIVAPPSECDNPGVVGVSGSGSTTSMPAALDLIGGTLQFRNDGSIGTRCTRFNFNPFNYYQTPRERYSFTTIGNYEINRYFDFYARATYSATTVRQQVAPSGVFGNRFEIPVMNPFIAPAARQAILDNVNGFLAANPAVTLADAGVNDLNSNGVFDMNDSITTPVRRRTLELGTRSELFETNLFQFVLGLRGDFIWDDWSYDMSFQYAESERNTVRDGYTNVSNIALQLNTISATQCETPGGQITAGCVPMNIFGGFGSISAAAADFGRAIALQRQNQVQTMFTASVNGPLNGLQTSWADNPVSVALGVEYREEEGEFVPDECLKEAPTSCQGGAGGNQLPIAGGFSVSEGFGEAFIPIVEGAEFAESLSLELGFRYSDYDISGSNETWKAGVSWEVVPGLRFRFMEQQAVRAPNVGELFSPVTTGLDNAQFDPCSVGNPNPIDANLRALCEQTGVLPALVGVVGDIVSGQINQFSGSDPLNLPEPETANTTTFGVVWQPDIGGRFSGTTISVDYYDIEIEDYIGSLSGQEALDACYVLADPTACAGVVRVGSSLATAGAGVPGFTTNLEYLRAEGIEWGVSTDFDLMDWGSLAISWNGNYYLTNESQSASTSPVTDCNGFYGTTCDPVPTTRWVQRTTWSYNNWDFGYNWRHIGSMDAEANEAASLFQDFRSIDAYNYIDLVAAWQYNDALRLQASVDNVFDEDPPIIGNDTGSTAFNGGNTFPSLYDVLGRVYTVGVTASF
jgi:iron complex outermembrane receptor protein